MTLCLLSGCLCAVTKTQFFFPHSYFAWRLNSFYFQTYFPHCLRVLPPLRSRSISPAQRHLHCERDLARAGVERAARLGRPRRHLLQRHLQEVPPRAGDVLTVRRQRGHLAAPPGPDAAPRGGPQPASPHAVQLRDPGGQRGFQQEPLHASVLCSEHHHESGR